MLELSIPRLAFGIVVFTLTLFVGFILGSSATIELCDPVVVTQVDTVVVTETIEIQVDTPIPDVTTHLNNYNNLHLEAVSVGQELAELLDGGAERLFYTILELEAKASANRDSAIQILTHR